MPTTPEQIADLISGYTDLKGYFENTRANIDANVAQMNSRVAAKEREVDNFIRDAKPEIRYRQEITIGGSTDFYYPVSWRFPDNDFGVGQITISRNYQRNGGPSERPLFPDRPHQAALLLQLEGNASSWSGNANFMQVKRFSERYTNTTSHLGFSMHCQAEAYNDLPLYSTANESLAPQCRTKSGVYLRGGGLTYTITKNWAGDIDFHDGSDQLRRVMSQTASTTWSVRWFATPIPLADRLVPIGSVNAYT